MVDRRKSVQDSAGNFVKAPAVTSELIAGSGHVADHRRCGVAVWCGHSRVLGHNFYRGSALATQADETSGAIDALGIEVPVEAVKWVWDDAMTTSWDRESVWFSQ